jgi:uncharacterized cupin superfamily protein
MCLADFAMSDLSATDIVDFASTLGLSNSYSPTPDRLLSGDPVHMVRNVFTDMSGQFSAGVWESTPGRWRVRYTENEFCHLLKGRVRIASDRREWVFGPGATFIIPAGFVGTWEVLEAAQKLYAVFERN